jgi:glutamate racemase
VTWLDPAPAIARRVTALIGPCPPEHLADTPIADAIFTGSIAPAADLEAALRRRGLTPGVTLDYPLQAG